MVTVLDTVPSPKDRWALFSRASDILALAQIKSKGDYEQHKEAIDAILSTENAALLQVIGLQELLDRVGAQGTMRKKDDAVPKPPSHDEEST